MPSTLNLSKPDRTVHIGVILISPHMELLDIAPVDMLSVLDSKLSDTMPVEQRLKDQAFDVEFHWVTESGGPHAGLSSGAQVKVTDSFATCPPLDIALIGAGTMGYEPTEGELGFIRQTAASCAAFLTVCGGVDYAARAGILNGKRATGPRFFLDVMRKQFPEVEWTDRRWERDGNVWSSGALINGLDMMREFIEAHWGGADDSIGRFWTQVGSAPIRDRDYKDDAFQVSGFVF